MTLGAFHLFPLLPITAVPILRLQGGPVKAGGRTGCQWVEEDGGGGGVPTGDTQKSREFLELSSHLPRAGELPGIIHRFEVFIGKIACA